MHSVVFLQDLAVVMIVAGAVTIVFHRLKQPVVLGYIIAGAVIGPHTPPFPLIHDQEAIDTLAELGVVLLMFSLGLEFNLRKLRQVGAAAFLAAFLEIVLMVWIGYEIGRLFGWSVMDSIFLGAILSVSSTTIIIKALGDLGKSRERFAQLIFGILIIEDILAIAMIALLSGVAVNGHLSFADLSMTVGRLAVFLVTVLVAGLITVPRLLAYVARFKSNEMLLVTVLGLCFGVSLLAAKLGYSVALGAFLIGAIIAEAREIHRVEALTEPIRDMFSAIFFVAIGLLIDPVMLAQFWLPILIITLAVVVGKVLTCSFGAFVGGNDTRTSLRVGMGLAQIGEFSFIIAALGQTLKVTSGFLYPIAVAISAVTALSTPYLIRNADAMVSWFDRIAPPSLVNTLEIYTRWVGQWGGARKSSLAARLIRRWVIQMALNVALITAVFIAAAYWGGSPPEWSGRFKLPGEWLKAVVWLAAALLSLPMFIATARKLQALGMLVADLKVKESVAGKHTRAIRAIVAQVIPIAGTVVLGLYVILLSSTLLSSVRVFLVLLVAAGLASWLLRRSFIRVYARAQVALAETLAEPPPVSSQPAPVIPPLLAEATLETVTIAANSPAVGRLIRQLELRSRTGVSIVGISRRDASLVNPGPDEEIQAGDRVLLLGLPGQMNAARAVFDSRPDQ